ncbi:penicillin-binding protein 1C [Brucepastera parasyntrophica]|uniref:penicillin-binding protein 1C n=1 Tax=Brucepastera parasyntrophica TaxID=2880008 RepID=UPI00210D0610|nr:penicillin-binding protein 1C [Brucepastera parasyntrophica]
MYDKNGEFLGARVASDGQWRFPPEPEVNEKFAIALIEYEDKRFKYHPGVDPAAIARAGIQNFRAGKIVSGGSTLTMQTVRLMRGNKKRTFPEKIIEAILALRLEIGRSKKDILALYAANAPFGGNVVGLEAASWRWFGRTSDELSWSEAATLAVLPNSPALVHPGKNRNILKEKRDGLLKRLAEKGCFDDETLHLAMAEPLPLEPKPLPQMAPHLFARIISEKEKSVPSGKRKEKALNSLFSQPVNTTLDISIQDRASAIVERWSSRFSGNDILNAACLILDTETGEVIAYIGNVDSPVARNVDIITSPRSSGSILKPFLYAAMLDAGELMPAELVSDIPTRVGSYRPENNTRTYVGVIPADQALARSLNIPAVRALRRYGIDRFARLLRQLGLTTLFRPAEEYGLPLILGGAEVTLWDICGIYAGLSRTVMNPEETHSQFFPPSFFSRAIPDSTAASPISPGAAWLTLETLTSVVRPAEEASWQNFASSHNIAWKTGTSFGFRDGWAVGTTSRWTVAVWVGNATGEGRAELRAATTAAPVLFEIFSFLEPSEWFWKPYRDLKMVEICALSGFPAGHNCESIGIADIPKNAPYRTPCPYCKIIVLNENEDRQIQISGETAEKTVQRTWFILPPAEEWYHRRWNLDYKVPPPAANSSGTVFPMALFNPEEKSGIFIPIEIDGSPGQMVFFAAHRDNSAIIHWHLDGKYLGDTSLFHEMEARPPPGSHTLTLIDNYGNMIRRSFTVLDAAD